jgi:hypothetical protein
MENKYVLSKRFCFVDNVPVQMFFVNEIPFAMDPLDDMEKQDVWILSECAINPTYTLDDVLRWSEYLIQEECHPVLFELELVTKEGLPDESIY